jgi:Tol biopolymer transport system component
MALRIGASLIVVLALAVVEVGCTGNDDEPSGRIVMFGSPDVLLIPAAGRKAERFRIDGDEFWDVAFSPDGSQVAFNPAPGADPDGITIMSLRNGHATVIPNQPSEESFESWGLAWAPDGRSLAFGNGDRVFTISIAGSDLRELAGGVFPTWTPDGKHIVFASGSYTGSDLDIAVVEVDGTGLRFLGRGLYPAVSPSGDEIAYSTPTGVFVVPFAGGSPRLVVPNGFGPVWSPDGRFLAFTRFTSCPTDGHGVCSGRVFVVAAEGGEPRAIGPIDSDPPPPRGWIP